MTLKMKTLTAVFAIGALTLTGCVKDGAVVERAYSSDESDEIRSKPAPTPSKKKSEELDREEVLRLYFASQGDSRKLIDSKVDAAYEMCEMADERGAREAVDALLLFAVSKDDYEVSMKMMEAIGAGMEALCPEHTWAF